MKILIKCRVSSLLIDDITMLLDAKDWWSCYVVVVSRSGNKPQNHWTCGVEVMSISRMLENMENL